MVAIISKKRPQLVYVSKRNATHSSEKINVQNQDWN